MAKVCASCINEKGYIILLKVFLGLGGLAGGVCGGYILFPQVSTLTLGVFITSGLHVSTIFETVRPKVD